EQLFELALDLRWSWDHSADELWGQIDPELWAVTHNPWVVPQTVSRTKLKELAANRAFRQQVEAFLRQQREYTASRGWFQQGHGKAPLKAVAYFNMEFMLSAALPIYS